MNKILLQSKSADKPTIQINADCGGNVDNSTTPSDSAYEANKLTDQNKGFKMMKMLGWSGGALGSGGGIEEPVRCVALKPLSQKYTLLKFGLFAVCN